MRGENNGRISILERESGVSLVFADYAGDVFCDDVSLLPEGLLVGTGEGGNRLAPLESS